MSKFVRIASLLAIALATIALVACGGDDDDEAAGDEVTVELAEFEGSGQTGTATLTADGETTRSSSRSTARCRTRSPRTFTKARVTTSRPSRPTACRTWLREARQHC